VNQQRSGRWQQLRQGVDPWPAAALFELNVMPDKPQRRYQTYDEMEQAGLVNTPWEPVVGAGQWEQRYGPLGGRERRAMTGEDWQQFVDPTGRASRAQQNWQGVYNRQSDLISYSPNLRQRRRHPGLLLPSHSTQSHERIHRGQNKLSTQLPESSVAAHGGPLGDLLLSGVNEFRSENPDNEFTGLLYDRLSHEMPAYEFSQGNAAGPGGTRRFTQLARDQEAVLGDYLDLVRWHNPDQSYMSLESAIPDELMRPLLQRRGPIVNRPDVQMQEQPIIPKQYTELLRNFLPRGTIDVGR